MAYSRLDRLEGSGDLPDDEHAIVPVVFDDAAEVAGKMLESGSFVTAFSFRRHRHRPISCAVESQGGRRSRG